MPKARTILRFPVRLARVGKSSRVVRLLRDTGLYTPLWILYSGLRRAELSRWADLRAFKKRYGPLLNGEAPFKGNGQTVMFPLMSPAIVITFIEGMLAKSLQLKGCRPIFVTNRTNAWVQGYLRVFGYRDFVYVEDYFPDPAEYEALATEMLGKCAATDDVVGLRFRDAEIGRYATSRAVKSLGRGTLNLTDKATVDELRRWLAISMRLVVAAERIIDTIHPDKLVVTEKGYTPWAEFYDVSLRRNIDTIQWFRSHLEHALLFRRYRYEDRYDHFFTLSGETWEEIKRLPWTHEQGEDLKQALKASYLSGQWFKRKNMLEGKRVKTPEQIRAELNLDPSKKSAFIFSHVLFDATFWYGTNLFSDYGTWLIETIRAACLNPSVNWVVKMHPDNVWKSRLTKGGYDPQELEELELISNHFPDLPSHVTLMAPENDTNTVSLFGFADYAITVRGTVGLEFPCFGTPTLTAGTGRYSGRGFTLDSDTPQEYLHKLEHIHEVPPMDESEVAIAQRFTQAVFNLKPMPIKSFRWTMARERQVSIHTPYDLTVNIQDQTELAQAQDLSAFADWVLHSSKVDFMMPHQGTSGGGAAGVASRIETENSGARPHDGEEG